VPNELEEVLRRLRDLLGDPSQLVTGVRSSGSRNDAIRRWKESCRKSLDEDPEKEFPLKKGSLEWYVWDHDIDAEMTLHLILTWSSDACYVYDVDFNTKILRNDEPKNFGWVMTESYTLPEAVETERYVCHPCTKKCVRAQATVYIYPTSATDNTDYAHNQGDEAGYREKLQPPVAPFDDDPDATWGVSRREPDGGSWKPFPR
jgi:hypothetical protein